MPPDVQRENRPDGIGRRLDGVSDAQVHRRDDLEARREAGLPAGCEPLAEMPGCPAIQLRAEPHRQPAVGDLGGQRNVPLPPERLAHQSDVLPGAFQRPRERLPVPALDDLRSARAKAEHEPPAAEVVQRQRRHSHRGWSAGRDLGYRGAQPDAAGCRAPPRQRRERVSAVGFAGPHRVQAQPVGFGDAGRCVGWRARRPGEGGVTELHDRPAAARSACLAMTSCWIWLVPS
jgi:hypothetical protein